MEDFHRYMSLRRDPAVSWLSVYPVREETKSLSDPHRPLYVNAGGGIGHQCAQFRAKYADIPGRVINQDLPGTGALALRTPGVDLTMMGIASMERTEAEWRALAERAGLERVRGYADNALEDETVLEMRLARGETEM